VLQDLPTPSTHGTHYNTLQHSATHVEYIRLSDILTRLSPQALPTASTPRTTDESGVVGKEEEEIGGEGEDTECSACQSKEDGDSMLLCDR